MEVQGNAVRKHKLNPNPLFFIYIRAKLSKICFLGKTKHLKNLQNVCVWVY